MCMMWKLKFFKIFVLWFVIRCEDFEHPSYWAAPLRIVSFIYSALVYEQGHKRTNRQSPQFKDLKKKNYLNIRQKEIHFLVLCSTFRRCLRGTRRGRSLPASPACRWRCTGTGSKTYKAGIISCIIQTIKIINKYINIYVYHTQRKIYITMATKNLY